MEKSKLSFKPSTPKCLNCGKEMSRLKLFAGKYCYVCFMLKAKVSDSEEDYV